VKNKVLILPIDAQWIHNRIILRGSLDIRAPYYSVQVVLLGGATFFKYI